MKFNVVEIIFNNDEFIPFLLFFRIYDLVYRGGIIYVFARDSSARKSTERSLSPFKLYFLDRSSDRKRNT